MIGQQIAAAKGLAINNFVIFIDPTRSWSERVGPCWAGIMRGEAKFGPLFIGYAFTGFIAAAFEIRLHMQPAFRFRSLDISKHRLEGA